MPVSGSAPPSPSAEVPLAVIRTTAGLTLAAAFTTAEESSMTMVPLVGRLPAPDAPGAAWRTSAPVDWRSTTVPPDASTADRTDTATMLPTPVRRGSLVTGPAATGSVGAALADGAAAGASIG